MDVFDIFQWILQKMLRTPFYKTTPDGCLWYLENLTFKHIILGYFQNLDPDTGPGPEQIVWSFHKR